MIEIRNKKISKEDFNHIREEVLSLWPTGKDINLEESFEFHKSLPAKKIFSAKLIKAKRRNNFNSTKSWSCSR